MVATEATENAPLEERASLDEQELRGLQRRLVAEFAVLPADEVNGEIASALGNYSQARIQKFVPLLVERHVRAQLRLRLTQARASTTNSP